MKKLIISATRVLFLLIFWLILASDFSLFNLILGFIIAILINYFFFYLFGPSPSSIKQPFLYPLRLTLYFISLLWEIFKANIDVATRVLDPDLPIRPEIVEFKTKLSSQLAKTFLANSITLTPGTLTVDIANDRFFVHCLTNFHKQELLSRKLEGMVSNLFKEY